MRLLVLSDSHRDVYSLSAAIRLHPEADVVVFLGDGEKDFMQEQIQLLLRNKKTLCVCGNCDFDSQSPEEQLCILNGKRIFILHGHTKSVKSGLNTLIDTAKKKQADLVLYGHTHCEKTLYADGIHVMCPGSIRNGSYGLADIGEQGIFCTTAYLNSAY